ncbi:methyltransferase [Streptomyces lusitanus]|uniref:Methyltransferase n=1 Tax=Streptomyces lusitanus TaxID=68232 RepID=A0ABU3JUY8_9ACTN|nr:methyltransferase [Streptomyces lusitanus]
MTATPYFPPSQVEDVLARHEAVARAAVVARPRPGRPEETELVAYAVPASAGDKEREAAQVEEWQQIFDRVYTSGPAQPFGENFSGWNSSYDGRPIGVEQMTRWRAATVDRIRELRPRRVLEIGVGSGLLLARLAADCESYWGTDFSGPAVDELARHVEERRELADRVTLRTQAADVVDGLPEAYFDTVVLNSVSQCFPSGEYLEKVVRGALGLLAPGGALFVGDVRDLRTVEYFHTAVTLHRRKGTDAAALAASADKSRVRDEELLVHPGFFARLAEAGLGVAAVDVQLQRTPFHNEMSRHRYDVVLRKAPAEVTEVSGCPSLAWGKDVTGPETLAERLATSPLPLRVTGIPNARLTGEIAARRALTEGDAPAARSALTRQDPAAVDPETLTRLAGDAGLRLALTPAPDDPGAFEAVFVPPGDTALDGVHRYAVDDPAPALTEIPAVAHRAGRFAANLRAWLDERLPGHARPAAVVVLDRMPTRPDGTTDVAALPLPAPAATRSAVHPSTTHERETAP